MIQHRTQYRILCDRCRSVVKEWFKPKRGGFTLQEFVTPYFDYETGTIETKKTETLCVSCQEIYREEMDAMGVVVERRGGVTNVTMPTPDDFVPLEDRPKPSRWERVKKWIGGER